MTLLTIFLYEILIPRVNPWDFFFGRACCERMRLPVAVWPRGQPGDIEVGLSQCLVCGWHTDRPFAMQDIEVGQSGDIAAFCNTWYVDGPTSVLRATGALW